MSLILYLISLVVTGLFVGALGRLLLPGRDPMSILQTIGVGVTATFISGLILWAIVGYGAGSLLLSIVVAVGIVYVIRRSRRGSASGHRGATPRFGGRSARNF
jgi:uncharacterized membrane protein YeaQ/YmgE (transglycosylase-associated protein family)